LRQAFGRVLRAFVIVDEHRQRGRPACGLIGLADAGDLVVDVLVHRVIVRYGPAEGNVHSGIRLVLARVTEYEVV
jgi:hypothetical protein